MNSCMKTLNSIFIHTRNTHDNVCSSPFHTIASSNHLPTCLNKCYSVVLYCVVLYQSAQCMIFGIQTIAKNSRTLNT